MTYYLLACLYSLSLSALLNPGRCHPAKKYIRKPSRHLGYTHISILTKLFLALAQCCATVAS